MCVCLVCGVCCECGVVCVLEVGESRKIYRHVIIHDAILCVPQLYHRSLTCQ